MRTSVKNAILAATVALSASTYANSDAAAYPIDCAILLCMAGGFPASAECTAAKAEVIRRITPIPVEPPLQMWLCPMRIDPKVAASIGLSTVGMNSKGYTKEVLDLQNSIDIYDIDYRISRGPEGETSLSETTMIGVYGDDEFSWRGASYIHGPKWLAEAVGGYRKDVYRDAGSDGQYQVKVGEENAYAGSFRAVVLRFRDHAGNIKIERVNY